MQILIRPKTVTLTCVGLSKNVAANVQSDTRMNFLSKFDLRRWNPCSHESHLLPSNARSASNK